MPEKHLGINADDFLVQALKNGDRHALSQLYDAYAPVLLGVITRIVTTSDIAEEVLKDTFLALYDRIQLFDDSNHRFLTWALALARGMALEAVNTKKYEHLLGTSEKIKFANAQEEAKRTQQDDQRIREAFTTLAPEEKAILDLIYLKGYSCTQAAQCLQITEQELKQRLIQAFKHIGAEKAA